MPAEVDWLIVGDFNLIRKPENRNKPGGDISDMFLFNEALSTLGVVELPLYGKKSLGLTSNSPHFWSV